MLQLFPHNRSPAEQLPRQFHSQSTHGTRQLKTESGDYRQLHSFKIRENACSKANAFPRRCRAIPCSPPAVSIEFIGYASNPTHIPTTCIIFSKVTRVNRKNVREGGNNHAWHNPSMMLNRKANSRLKYAAPKHEVPFTCDTMESLAPGEQKAGL